MSLLSLKEIMRRPEPYKKQSHKAWYVNLNGRPQRLASFEEGEEAAYREYDRLMADRQPVRKDYTVAELFDYFLEYHHQKVVAGKGAQETYDFYARPLNSFIEHIGKSFRSSKLKPLHVEQWCGQGGSDTYRHNKMRAIRAAMRWAKKRGYIASSPLEGMDIPSPTPRDLFLTPDQWEKVLALTAKARDGGCLHDAFVVSRETGCRVQELRRFEAKDLDRERRCFVLEKKDSKGKKGRRVVHLTDTAFEIVDRLTKKYQDGPLFRTSKGSPWTRHTLHSRCVYLKEKLGFTIRTGAIRHTFATYGAINEVDIKTLADLMGHKDLKMLHEVYSHVNLLDEHMKKALKKATG